MTVPHTYGNAMLLRIAGTRDNVVFNHTFMITASHSYKGMITQLVSGSFTNYTLRLVTGVNGQSYVEIYDDAQGATSSITQTLFCYAKMLSQNGMTAILPLLMVRHCLKHSWWQLYLVQSPQVWLLARVICI